MWSSFSSTVSSLGLKKKSTGPTQATSESSDDETCSNASNDEGLECPICWESFNIVENVPYVLWCGHTLCKNCVLGLQKASLKLSAQKIQIPLFISCPWCHLLTLRLVYRGNIRFPHKNYFLLWMVESLNGDRMKHHSVSCGDHQSIWSPRRNSTSGNQAINTAIRRPHRLVNVVHNSNDSDSLRNHSVRLHLSLHKSLDFFIHLIVKFPLVIMLLLIVLFVIPASAAIFGLYLLVTILFAVPSFLTLYFAYPALDWLAREITS